MLVGPVCRRFCFHGGRRREEARSGAYVPLAAMQERVSDQSSSLRFYRLTTVQNPMRGGEKLWDGKKRSSHMVISTGGGIIETERGRSLLNEHAPVVYLRRDINDIERYLEGEEDIVRKEGGRSSSHDQEERKTKRGDLSNGSDGNPKDAAGSVGTDNRPVYAGGASVRTVWQRRRKLYGKCSTHDFLIRRGENDWAAVDKDIGIFARTITGLRPCDDGAMDPLRYYVSLTMPSLATHTEKAKLCKIVRSPYTHALELRADLWEDTSSEFVLEQIAIARRAADLSGIPLIFTVRSKNQGGDFFVDCKDDATEGIMRRDATIMESAYFALLWLGVRAGCEYVDVEACWSRSSRQAFYEKVKQYSSCKVICSFHNMTVPLAEAFPDQDSLNEIMSECAFSGGTGVVTAVKVVFKATDASDCTRLSFAADAFNAALHGKGTIAQLDVVKAEEKRMPSHVIALCVGSAGRLSRALNAGRSATPVAMPRGSGAPAAPGQLSAAEIMRIRASLGVAVSYLSLA